MTLDHCIIPFNTLVTLINYFSNLDRLDIYSVVSPEDDDEPTPLSRPVPKLHIADCYGRCDLRSLLGQLSTLGPVFDDIIIEGQDFLSTPTLQCILCTVGANAKRLKLLYDLEDRMYLTRAPAMRLAKSSPMLHQITRPSTVCTLSLPRARGVGDYFDGSRVSIPHCPRFHHLHERSKDRIHVDTLLEFLSSQYILASL